MSSNTISSHCSTPRRIALPPLSVPELNALFGYLERELAEAGCDNRLRITTTWLTDRGHEVIAVSTWLRERGGYCDCEVLTNVTRRM